MRFLRVLLGVLLLAILIVFAILNRAPVEVNLDPVLPYALSLPLYLLVFIVFFAGLLVGALADRWNAAASARRRAKAAREAAARNIQPAPERQPGTALARPGETDAPPPAAPVV
ncbi:MAG TPA: LapA family protein [Ferrovibrio sp.]|jgi:uncharacterized integral membrane protein|uniref:LapA family protein n=1 Tax=Ferrovibrio sp. TaxID=1917215 RepID=UPI002B4B02C6|nr:LapA family protein [Ferrovibrio sp.]HLT79362.1 LapA family protein [Ferrovibrio sp.]